jgi:arabinogalactan endo-1,4-beta-galactosidase
MLRQLLPLLLALSATAGRASDYAIGADVSFLQQAEAGGAVYSDHGRPGPALRILHDHGYGWVRLRLFHTPTDLPNSLEYTIAVAQQAKSLGMKVLLDFHYADSWADPQQQPMPRAWAGFSHEQLVNAVFTYTRDSIARLQEAGVLPEMVQIGNEITNGMLWPDGRLPQNWDHLAQLIYAGINGMDAGRGNGRRPRVMIHIDRGADRAGSKAFLDKLASYEIPYDIIGQSYYPWFQGTLDDLRANLSFMAREYQKDIIVVEAAYNWKPAEYIGKAAPFEESPEGQRAFLEELNRTVLATPDGRGKGVFWWEPVVVGHLSSRGFFDDQKRALPVLNVFDRFTRK